MRSDGVGWRERARVAYHVSATFFLTSTRASDLCGVQEIGGVVIDLYWLSLLVGAHGGLQSVINTKSWGAVATDLKLPRASERDARLQACYYQFLLSYDMLSSEEKKAIEGRILQARTRDVVEEFGYVKHSHRPHPAAHPCVSRFVLFGRFGPVCIGSICQCR